MKKEEGKREKRERGGCSQMSGCIDGRSPAPGCLSVWKGKGKGKSEGERKGKEEKGERMD